MRSVFWGEANTFNIIISVEHSVHRGAHLGVERTTILKNALCKFTMLWCCT